MEDKFTNSDFEEFLQDQVRNHRMYPSDTVWREINKKLHGDKTWPALTIAALALLTATVVICIYFTPKPNIFAIKPNEQTVTLHNNDNVLNSLTSPRFSKKKEEPLALQNKQEVVQNVAFPSLSKTNNKTKKYKNQDKLKEIDYSKAIRTGRTAAESKEPGVGEFNANLVSLNPSDKTFRNGDAVNTITLEKVIVKTLQPAKESLLVVKDYNDKNMVDNFLKDHKEDISLYTQAKKKSIKNKFSFQIYAGPSISYRKLIEDRSIVEGNNVGPVGLNYVTDVNKVVRHKPGTGLEAGVNFMYNLSNSFRVKTGFQFNMRQYSIEAFRSNTELASIALVGSNGVDTINSLASYRTSNGYYSDELVNRYFQLAVPIGVEWEFIGNKRIQLNVAASIQPTYLLNRNAFLLSTNFKNYTENPDMVRRWNINSNIEAFVSFKVGDYKWQLGPQIRYQPYSTYIREYPIKEHLLDYGIKLGVSKNFD